MSIFQIRALKNSFEIEREKELLPSHEFISQQYLIAAL